MSVSDQRRIRDYEHDFDLDAPDFAENYDEVLTELVSTCPVAHSKVAGGYWVVTRYDDVKESAQDWETFSSEGGFEPGRGGEGGAKLYPVELDPPYQTRWRQALGPYFTSKGRRTLRCGARWRAGARRGARWPASSTPTSACVKKSRPATISWT